VRARVLAVACLACACATFALARQQAAATLTLVSPAAESYVSGSITLEARIDPESAAVQSVTFFGDGRSVCVLRQAPWQCTWDSGVGVREHVVRVAALLADGTRLVKSIRTRGTSFVESVDVDAVQVTVTVTDRHGKVVRGLPRSAFSVKEDGRAQQITAFASEHIALEIVVALDVSQSMTSSIPVLKTASRGFLSALRPADQVTLLAFNDNIFTLARRSTNPAQRLKAVDRLAPWGGTALYDAILTGLNVVGRQPGRRSIVVFTDGEDQSSIATLDRVRTRMETSDATVYTIGLGRGIREDTLKNVLQRLATMSGGRSFVTEKIDRLQRAFDEIIDELSGQYLLAYVPSNDRRDGTWRRIQVEVSNGQYQVRAREGYRAPGKRR
jgi:Ca-activated chloride channel family protein